MHHLRKLLSAEPINRDWALLIIRFVVGLSMFLFHGYGKLTGGPEVWGRIGSNMEVLGISFAPVFWGFLAAFAESACSLALMFGILFRPAAAMLAFTMFVAVLRHLNLPAEDPSSGWKGASHALELLSVYVGLLLVGAGRFRIPIPRGRADESPGSRVGLTQNYPLGSSADPN
jgi:putative oxidoreductase